MKKINYSQFIEKLHSEAMRARWKTFYDDESDSLFWTKQPVPSDNRLAKVAKEITFYLDKGGIVNGVIIQPFLSNFLSHNEEIAGVAKVLTNTKDKISPQELKTAESLLSTTIKKDIYQDIAETKYSLKDLNHFLASASK